MSETFVRSLFSDGIWLRVYVCMQVVVLSRILLISAATAGVLNFLQNYFGTFGVSITNSRNFHVWIFAGLNITDFSSLSLHYGIMVYLVTLYFNSTIVWRTIYKKSNASISLVTTYSGADLQSGKISLTLAS